MEKENFEAVRSLINELLIHADEELKIINLNDITIGDDVIEIEGAFQWNDHSWSAYYPSGCNLQFPARLRIGFKDIYFLPFKWEEIGVKPKEPHWTIVQYEVMQDGSLKPTYYTDPLPWIDLGWHSKSHLESFIDKLLELV